MYIKGIHVYLLHDLFHLASQVSKMLNQSTR
jgi:hypothetical protein